MRQVELALTARETLSVAITIPTVLILGAGASKHAGFPVGKELRDQILRPPQRLADAIRSVVPDEALRGFQEELSQSGQRSVDRFPELNEKWLDFGK